MLVAPFNNNNNNNNNNNKCCPRWLGWGLAVEGQRQIGPFSLMWGGLIGFGGEEGCNTTGAHRPDTDSGCAQARGSIIAHMLSIKSTACNRQAFV